MMNNLTLQSIGLFITFILMFCGFVVYHENAHEQIYKANGCRETYTEYSLTYAEAKCRDMHNYDYEKGTPQQLFNEIVGYNIMMLLVSIFGCTWWILIALDTRER